MRLRRLLGLGTLFVGGILAADRLTRAFAGPVYRSVQGDTHRLRVNGADVAVYARGPTDGEDILLVHAPWLGGSAREFDRLADALADEARVWLIDLPGFGASDRPAVGYTPTLMARSIERVVEEYLDAPIIVTSDQSIAYAIEASHAIDPRAIVAISPRDARPHRRPVLSELLYTPVIGAGIHLALACRANMAVHLEEQFDRSAANFANDELTFAWRCAHQPGARRVIAAQIGGDLDVITPLATAIDAATVPIILLTGEEASSPSVDEVRDLSETTGRPLGVATDVGRAPHVDAPRSVASFIHEQTAGN